MELRGRIGTMTKKCQYPWLKNRLEELSLIGYLIQLREIPLN